MKHCFLLFWFDELCLLIVKALVCICGWKLWRNEYTKVYNTKKKVQLCMKWLWRFGYVHCKIKSSPEGQVRFYILVSQTILNTTEFTARFLTE